MLGLVPVTIAVFPASFTRTLLRPVAARERASGHGRGDYNRRRGSGQIVRTASRWLALAAVVALAQGCARPAADSASRPAAPSPGLAELVRSYDRDVTPYYPFTATERGLQRYDRVLANDIGEEYRRGMQALCARYRAALRGLDTASLADQDRLTHDILAHRLDTCLEGLAQPWHLLPINQTGQPWPSRFPVVGAGRGVHPFRTARNYEDFLGRIDGFVTWVDTAIANMRTGIERGVTHPREVMLKVLPQLDAHIVDDPRTSLFYEPIRTMPPAIDGATRRSLEVQYVDAIRDRIVPAYRRLRAFVHDEYLPRCRTSAGFGDLPGGREMYAHAIRTATTTTRTADEIHELGLREVARLSAEIERLRAEIRAAGDPPLPRYRTVDELVAAYGELRHTVEAALPRAFGRFPRAGYEIRPIEAFRERSMPSSYNAASLDGSRPGVFYLNTSEISEGRTAGVSRSLFLHEAVPGHHFQMMLQRENAELPGFRRFGWYVAFGEGWALYAEGLGAELGAYATRRDRLTMLLAERFRAARLVVDTGLHARGWTRQRAIEYLGGQSTDTVREVERYMVWPGQALGYKIGQLTILAIRKKAEAALGAAFDLRAFHDELLRDGAMPLSVLEAKMDRWIGAQRRG
jgi:uncharacterized protein (DUF885 family)